jgi:hypothetical protein
MDPVVAFAADDEGLPPQGSHSQLPIRGRLTCSDVEVRDPPEVVDFDVLLRSATLTGFRQESLFDFRAVVVDDTGSGVDVLQ